MESKDDEGQDTGSVASGQGLVVSKTAYVNGPDVCGQIRIFNFSGFPANVIGIVDWLEVHFPNNVPPPGLVSGSDLNWFKVADVPIALPGIIVPFATLNINYCHPLCETAHHTRADYMRNVVRVSISTPNGQTRTFPARSNSFRPPVLDCQACCLPNGGCTDTVPARCSAANGLTRGADTVCSTTPCTQACCLGSGTCEDRTVSECASENGAALGLGTICDSASCLGACCDFLSGPACFNGRSKAECELDQGTFLGIDTSCETEFAVCPTGACCRGADDCIDFMTESGCDLFVHGAFLGIGTTCDTSDTTCLGACCDPLSGPACFNDFTKAECELVQGGTFLGLDTSCEAEREACPTGACCGGNGNCFDLMSEGGCAVFLHGTFLGVGTTCDSTNPTCRGACCDPLSGPACFDDFTKIQCELDQGGTFLGLDTACASALAACPTGACCSGTGSCFDLMSEGGCAVFLQGTFLGVGTSCSSSNCNRACCFGTTCQELSSGECTAQGGQPQAVGTGCPNLGPTPCDVASP
jgi:hypothetical protein